MVATRRSSRLRGATPLPQVPGAFDDVTSRTVNWTPLKRRSTDGNQKSKTPACDASNKSPDPVREENIELPDSKSPKKITSLLDRFSTLAAKAKAVPQSFPEGIKHAPRDRACESSSSGLDSILEFPKVPQTEPVRKTANIGSDLSTLSQQTPTRSTLGAKDETPTFLLNYDFSFNPQASIDSGLSDAAKRIMEETREEAVKIRAKMIAARDRQEARDQQAADIPVFGLADLPGRKFAKPRGRFSGAHKKQFDRMDSILTHPSAMRSIAQAAPAVSPLPKNAPPKSLKRPRSYGNLRTPTKEDQTSSYAGPKFTPIPARDFGIGSMKRLKLQDDVDTSTTRDLPDNQKPVTKLEIKAPHTTGKLRAKSGIPLSRSTTCTPTKASMARSQSVKSLKKTSSISYLPKSPSMKQLSTSPSKSWLEPKSPSPSKILPPGQLSKMASLPSLRSILRRAPARLYSDDPSKIAAGTHIPTPHRKSTTSTVPATAPVKKHVDFTASVKGEESEVSQNTPSGRSKRIFTDATESLNQASDRVVYPILPVFYPDVSYTTTAGTRYGSVDINDRPKAVPKSKRRQTIGLTTGSNDSKANANERSEFTFRTVHKTPSFQTAATPPTIRRVRPSDVSAPIAAIARTSDSTGGPNSIVKKRKLVDVEEGSETSDKENVPATKRSAVASSEVRPMKKAKIGVENQVKHARPEAKGRMPMLKKKDAVPKKSGGLSRSRLALLAMPKKQR